MKAALALKGRSREHGRKLWKQYKTEGLSGYMSFKHKGQVSPLKDKQELLERLKTEGFSSIKEA